MAGGAAVGAAELAAVLVGLWTGTALVAAGFAPGLGWLWACAAAGAAGFAPGLAGVMGGAGLGATVSGGAAALASAVAAGVALARDVAALARVLDAVLPGRAVGVFFALVLAVVPDREVAAVGFGLAPGPDPVGRVPAAGSPEELAGSPVPSAALSRAADSVASMLPWSRSAEAALAALGRLAALVWLSGPADCLLAARLGAGSVPCPAELSPGIPFSEVTAP